MNPLVGNSHQGASLSHCRLSEAPFWLLHQQHKGDSSCRYLLKCAYFLTKWPRRTLAWLAMCTMLLQPGRKSRPAYEPRYKRRCVFHVNVGAQRKRRASAFVRWLFCSLCVWSRLTSSRFRSAKNIFCQWQLCGRQNGMMTVSEVPITILHECLLLGSVVTRCL